MLMALVKHKAGFVSMVGKPNVGKSTLMNTLLGEKLSVVTAKAQTTRHRITGMLHGDNFQIIYTDTPGIITPHYALQQSMMRTVRTVLADTDVLLWMVDIRDRVLPTHLHDKIKRATVPILLLLNKRDLVGEEVLQEALQYWAQYIPAKVILPISALHDRHTEHLLHHILTYLPEHPPYYPKDMLTDHPTRFFVAEIIREKILQHYQQEIPYSVEIVVNAFKEERRLVKIDTTIHVERQSQKVILIGHKGHALKKVGTEARHDLEAFLGKKVWLDQHVKVVAAWRKNTRLLRQFGYI